MEALRRGIKPRFWKPMRRLQRQNTIHPFICSIRMWKQVHMIIAFESLDYYDPERYILSVVNSLLGGNVNSRLFQTIREEMGLSYAIYSYGGSYEKRRTFSYLCGGSSESGQAGIESGCGYYSEVEKKSWYLIGSCIL